MSILSTSSRLIKVGQDYSAGSGISIDDGVISVTGEFGKTYSAGQNVDIYEQDEQLYISSKDWSQDIADASANAYNTATAQIPEPQDLSYISSKVDDKLESTAFTNWQTGQYSTDLQTIEGQITNKLDTSSFSEVSASFLTAINIPESATWNEVSTTVQSNSAQWSDNTGDEEVNSFVYDNSATINDVNSSYQTNSGNFLTGDYVSGKNVLSDGYDEIASVNISGDVSVERIYDDGDLHHVLWKYSLSSIGYTLKSNSGDWNKIKNTNTLKTYNNKYEMFDHAYKPVQTDYTQNNIYNLTTAGCDIMTESIAKIKITVESTASFLSGYNEYFYNYGNYWLLESSGNGSAIYIHDENYPGKNYASIRLYYYNPVKTLVSVWYKKYDGINLKEIGFKDDIDYLSGAIDYVSANAGDQEVNSLVHSNSATWDSVSNKLDTTAFSTVSGNFLTAVDLTPYATTNDLEQVSGDITSLIPSTAGLASESYVQNNSAVLTGMIDSKQDTLTFGYDGQDKISAINNSAIAGGAAFDVFPISGTGAVNVYEQNSALWISGKDFTSDISYISGTIGDVETLLASL